MASHRAHKFRVVTVLYHTGNHNYMQKMLREHSHLTSPTSRKSQSSSAMPPMQKRHDRSSTVSLPLIATPRNGGLCSKMRRLIESQCMQCTSAIFRVPHLHNRVQVVLLIAVFGHQFWSVPLRRRNSLSPHSVWTLPTQKLLLNASMKILGILLQEQAAEKGVESIYTIWCSVFV